MTETDREYVSHLMKQFAHTLCQAGKEHGWTLDALRDLARVLRPPDTINHKYGTPVEIIADATCPLHHGRLRLADAAA